MPAITLTTDFGAAAPYVAAMKGAILSVQPHAQIVDLGHDLPAQDILHASHFLAQAAPFFPAGTIHVCVVDPGVGTSRALLLAEAGGQYILAPDNGVLSRTLAALGGVPVVRQLTTERYWRPNPSKTFHGRDILAPVAAHLAAGVPADAFGPLTDQWIRLSDPEPTPTPHGADGVIVFVDGFGNLITNVSANMLPSRPMQVQIGSHDRIPFVSTYGDALPGTLVALIGSNGRLEVAQVCGNAAKTLQIGVGDAVQVRFRVS